MANSIIMATGRFETARVVKQPGTYVLFMFSIVSVNMNKN